MTVLSFVLARLLLNSVSKFLMSLFVTCWSDSRTFSGNVCMDVFKEVSSRSSFSILETSIVLTLSCARRILSTWMYFRTNW